MAERSATCLRFAEREHVRVARRQDPRFNHLYSYFRERLAVRAASVMLQITRISMSTSTARISQRFSGRAPEAIRSEEHTSELQSRLHLVCRLLLEKKKNI